MPSPADLGWPQTSSTMEQIIMDGIVVVARLQILSSPSDFISLYCKEELIVIHVVHVILNFRLIDEIPFETICG